jgi:amidohydrolase
MLSELKAQACAAVDAMAADLLAMSHTIHANPELGFEEHKAAATLTEAIGKAGLAVQQGVYGLPTAFAAEFGADGHPRVAILAEYDALPGIGHACGHNIIATAGVGAALALSKLGRLPGRVLLMGTPAEEGGGGKELMARAGAFDGVDAAMMVHPAGVDAVTTPTLAIGSVCACYGGKAAHASAMPHEGINALDGLVTAYQAIAQLRQHIRQSERIHGIITDGGKAPNVVPDRAEGKFYVRAADAAALAALKQRVAGCFRAGSEASGATLELDWGDVDYLELRTSWPLADAWQANAEALGRHVLRPEELPLGWAGSTDMGNVSQRVPSIHPLIATSPPEIVIHNPAFAEWAASPRGDKAALDGAKTLAMTALDFMCDVTLREAVRAAFRKAM